jgi:hypothetical protein
MSSADDFIKNFVGEQAKPLAKEILNELSELLKILQEKGLLRERLSGTLQEKREIIVQAQKNNDAILAALNTYYAFYVELNKRQKYFEFMRSNGFDDLALMHLLHSQLIFAYLTNIETFKNYLNLILKDSTSDYTLGKLFGKNGLLSKSAPELTNNLSNRLDIELRNAFSHYTFIEEGPYIHYYSYKKDKKQEPPLIMLYENRIKSAALYERNMEVSLMKVILGCLIADKYGK